MMNAAERPRRSRHVGIGLALVAAAISGVAIFLNGVLVQRAASATVYTTAKNMIAAAILLLVLLAEPRGAVASLRAVRGRQLVGLAAVGIVGGGLAFVLFFEGLRRASSTDAAFIQKTLVIWVALLAVPLLRERIRAPHVAAIVLLIAGQASITGDMGWLRDGGRGELMILGATLLWSAEVVVARTLLRTIPSQALAVGRMGIGSVALLGWLLSTGSLSALTALGPQGWADAAITGAVLAGYVTVWLAALARAGAVDVTAMLVAGAFVTAILDATFHHASLTPHLGGLALIAGGTVVMLIASMTPRAQGAPSPVAT